MAGDWIKVEHTTPEKPEVFAIAEELGIDPDTVFGKLMRIWIWADRQTINGNAPGVTLALIDRYTGVSGFAKSMIKTGWLVEKKDGFQFSNFENHNGETAKQRALTAKRVSKYKKEKQPQSNAISVTDTPQINNNGNAPSVTGTLPREEEEKNKEISSDEDIKKVFPPTSEHLKNGTFDPVSNPPTAEAVQKIARERYAYPMNLETAEKFIRHYSATGWMKNERQRYVDWTQLISVWKEKEYELKATKKPEGYDPLDPNTWPDEMLTDDLRETLRKKKQQKHVEVA